MQPLRGLGAWTIIAIVLLAVILTPFVLFEDSIAVWTERLIRSGGRGGLAAAVVMLLALDVLLPIPSSIVSTAAGAMLGFLPGFAASTAGMTLGCLIGYVGGRKLGSPLLHRLVGEGDLQQVSSHFRRSASWALATMRPIPVLAEASALFAGVSGVPLPVYFAVTTLANAGISAVYCTAGAYAWNSGSFLLAFAGSIALPGAAMLIRRFRSV